MTKFLTLLAVLAIILSSSSHNINAVATTTTDILRFDKSSLTLQDNVVSDKLGVCLQQKPSKPVTVYMEAINTKFDKCALTFTPDNWNTPQPVQVVALPNQYISQSNNRQVPIKFITYAPDCATDFHNRTQMLMTTRLGSGQSGSCQITGDPHYKAFDQSELYHYQGTGDYYLVKSDAITIQARKGQCSSIASCVHALAIRYGKTTFVVDGNVPNYDETIKAITALDGVIISKSRTGTMRSFDIVFNAGSSIRIDITTWGQNYYMNVFINLAGHMKGKVNGMCGRWNDNSNNPFTDMKGQITFDPKKIIKDSNLDVFCKKAGFSQSPLAQFADAWRVPDSDNIFKCKDQCPDAKNSKAPIDSLVAECKIPAPNKCIDAPKSIVSNVSSSKSSTSTSVTSSSSTVSTTSVLSTTAGKSISIPSITPIITTPTVTLAPLLPTTFDTTTTNLVISTPTVLPSIASSSSTSSTTSTTSTTPSSTSSNIPSATPTELPQEGCPKPIVVVPVLPGYVRETAPPRYVEEPRKLDYAELPTPPRDVIEQAKLICEEKIISIELCDADINKYVMSCKHDIEAQLNPDVAACTYRDMYTAECARNILSKAKAVTIPVNNNSTTTTNNSTTTDIDMANKVKQVAIKYCFGNVQCDDQCLQCTVSGCTECKDRNKFDIQGGKCVPRQSFSYNTQYFTDQPKYEPLAHSEITPPGMKVNDGDDLTANVQAMIQADTVTVGLSEANPARTTTDNNNKKSVPATPTSSNYGDIFNSSAHGRLVMSWFTGIIAIIVYFSF